MLNIAIDGPSGAGKSTIAKAIAEKLNIIYLDTGAMYRAIALKMYRKGIDCNDNERVLEILDDIDLKVEYIDGIQKVLLDGEDVSEKIREHIISKMASDVSKIKEVRLKLVAIQREIAKNNNVILDGRDIASYVLPNADYKFYLTASAEERASRRYKELVEKGQKVEFITILNDIKDRDFNDMNREFAPLVSTKDSIYIDSTNYTLNETIDLILSYIKKDNITL